MRAGRSTASLSTVLQGTAGTVRVPARCADCYVVDTLNRAGVESTSGDPERGAVMEPQHGERPHLPGPSPYPIAFAAGIASILVGLIVNPLLVAPIAPGIPTTSG